MPKATSSASSATRKKHAKKQAKRADDDDELDTPQPAANGKKQPLQRGQKKESKRSKREAKVKRFVPPPKPPKGVVDPVDLYGLGVVGASPLPPEVVVILRMLAKRSENTIVKAVEDLDEWVRRSIGEGEEGVDQVVLAIPIWVHHFPRLSTHSSRRIRLLTATLTALLASEASPIRSELLLPVHLEHPDFIGAWCASAFDVDRIVRTAARAAWDNVVDISSSSDAHATGAVSLSTYAPEIIGYLGGQLPLPEPEPKPAPTKGKAGMPAPPVTVDENEEDPLGKHSRLASGALDALACLTHQSLAPTLFEALLTSDDFWPRLDSRVDELPLVRRSLWQLLSTLLRQPAFAELFESFLPALSRSALHAAFAERDATVQSSMWEPLLLLLRAQPRAWSLSDDRGDDESSSDEDGTDGEADKSIHDSREEVADLSPIILELLTFLQLGCRGVGASYPAIVVLISTIPDTILPSSPSTADSLFASFWAAFDGRALDAQGAAALRAFFASVIECSVLFSNRLRAADEAEAASKLVIEQCDRVWRELLGLGALQARRASAVTTQMAEMLVSTEEKRKDDAISLTPTLRKSALEAVEASDDQIKDVLPRLGNGLIALASAPQTASTMPVELLQLVFDRNLDRLTAESDINHVRLALTEALLGDETSRKVCLASSTIGRLDTFVAQRLVSSSDSQTFVSALLYLSIRGVESSAVQTIWATITSDLVHSASPLTSPRLDALRATKSAGKLPDGLADSGLGEVLLARVAAALESGEAIAAEEEHIIADLLCFGEPLIDDSSRDQVLALICTSAASADAALLLSTAVSPAFSLLKAVTADVKLLERIIASDILSTGLAASFEVAYFAREANAANAKAVWARWIESGANRWACESQVLERIETYLDDPELNLSVEMIITAVDDLSLPTAHTIDAFLRSPEYMQGALQRISIGLPAPTLAIFDPLIPASSASIQGAPSISPYVRRLLVAVRLLGADRALLRDRAWLLPHITLLSLFASDESALQLASATIFGSAITQNEADAITSACDILSVSMLSSMARTLDNKWHETTVAALRPNVAADIRDANDLTAVLTRLASDSSALASWNARVFARLLAAVMRYSDAGQAEAERWLALAQTLQKNNPLLSLAILYSIRDFLFEAPRFQRYQNELASTLSGIKAADASTVGATMLRLLVAVAPSADSDVLFLPQQRTIFLLQSLQKWFAAEDDNVELSDEVHAMLAELFVVLAPVVQDRTGGHWDFMFDVLESNIETASLADESSLSGLFQSLRLLSTIGDLARANSDLRETVKARFGTSLDLVRSVVYGKRESKKRSAPATATLKLALDLVSVSPGKASSSNETSFSAFSLLVDIDPYVQHVGFALAKQTIEMQVKDLVVEVELATEALPTIELPRELLSLATRTAHEAAPHEAITHLLAWLLVFEYFSHASFQVRSAYLDQLRHGEWFEKAFLPTIFLLTNVSERATTFDLTPWGFDEPTLVDLDDASSVPLLAAHAYLRALQTVPSLVRAWWESLRDRQYSMAVSAFTSKHFSPLLISREMAHVSAGDLTDEDMTVKISTTGMEVKAVYTVDETPLELSIRLPAEFPLAAIEVKDSRKVGVTEAQWRGWILAVQQTIMSQNGLISDALALFKRNIALHFEGVEPCAICYSIISVVDRSTPGKKCRTCKNGFHGSCLYKWFQTSHSSTCPLCRSTV